MPRTSWHNLNANRAYPFVSAITPRLYTQQANELLLPNTAVTDFGATVGYAPPEFSEARVAGEQLQAVYLYSIQLNGSAGVVSSVQFTFKCEDVDEISFVFTFPSDAPFGATQYVTASAGAGDLNFEWGEAFMSAGYIQDVIDAATALPVGTPILYILGNPAIFEHARVEQATLMHRYRHALKRIFVGNDPFVYPVPCEDSDGRYADFSVVDYEDGTNSGLPCPEYRTIKVTTPDNMPDEGLVGVVRFEAGYNATVRLLSEDSVLELGASQGDGDGEICQEDGNEAWDNIERTKTGQTVGESLGVGNNCRGLIYTINGVAPSANGDFRIDSATGVVIGPVSKNDTVIESWNAVDITTPANFLFEWSSVVDTGYELEYSNDDGVTWTPFRAIVATAGTTQYQTDLTAREWFAEGLTTFRVVLELREIVGDTSLTPSTDLCAPFDLVIEAEDYIGIYPIGNAGLWPQKKEDELAVRADPDDTISCVDYTAGDQTADVTGSSTEYEVIIPTESTYSVWVRARITAPVEPVVRIEATQVGGSAATLSYNATSEDVADTQSGANYGWFKLQNTQATPTDPLDRVRLTGGSYILRAGMRTLSGFIRIDQILVTSNVNYIPVCGE